MPKISPISSKDLLKVLSSLGFVPVHQKGSHLRLMHHDGRRTTVPIHAGEKVGKGLLRQILRDINLTPEDFIKLK